MPRSISLPSRLLIATALPTYKMLSLVASETNEGMLPTRSLYSLRRAEKGSGPASTERLSGEEEEEAEKEADDLADAEGEGEGV